jgi:hypothetical protein
MRSRNSDRYLEQEFMRPDYVNNEAGKNPAAILDRREAERVLIDSHVSYASDDDASLLRGEGQLLNLSKLGCRIVGPVLAVGSHTTISLDLNDGKAPLRLVGTTVCWSDGYSFGVKFPSMSGEDRKRLQELVLKFASVNGASNEYMAFRLA